MAILQKAVFSASPELLAPGRANAATQSELLFKHATTQVSGCGMCEGVFLEVGRISIAGSRTGASAKTLGF